MINYEIKDGTRDGAIELYFDAKPNASTREILKSNKMRWNKTKSCWWGFVDADAIKNALADADATIEDAISEYYTKAEDGYLGGFAFQGSKTDRYLYGAELTKAIRESLKRCGIHGCTVSHDSFSGGQSVTVKIKMKADEILTEEEFIKYFKAHSHMWDFVIVDKTWMSCDKLLTLPNAEQEQILVDNAKRVYKSMALNGHDVHSAEDEFLTEKGAKRFSLIDRIVQSYNSGDENLMVDYMQRHFYEHYTIRLA